MPEEKPTIEQRLEKLESDMKRAALAYSTLARLAVDLKAVLEAAVGKTLEELHNTPPPGEPIN